MNNIVIPFLVSSMATPLIIYTIIYFSRRHQVGRDDDSGGYVLEYSKSWKVASVVLLVIATLLISIPAVLVGPKEPEDPYIISALFIILVGGSMAKLFETHGVRVVVSDVGIEANTPWRRKRKILWSDVKCIKYNRYMQWIVVVGNESTVRINEYVSGIDIFKDFVKRNLSHEKYSNCRLFYEI